MSSGETRHRLTRLQNIHDHGVNRRAYLNRQLDQLAAIKDAADDPADFWAKSYRFAKDFRHPGPPLGPKGEPNPDALFYLAFTRVHVAGFNEPTPFADEYHARFEALREKYGWPEEDEEGELWSPEDNIPADELPADYVALSAGAEGRFEAEWEANSRRVFVRYGVEDMLDLRERDRDEFERRMKAGRDFLGLDRLVDGDD